MSVLSELQEWFASQCDGDWEHGHGIRIESLDNPGWFVIVDLARTALASAKFEEIKVDNGRGEWAAIRVTDDGVWQAASDPGGLEAAIARCLSWAAET